MSLCEDMEMCRNCKRDIPCANYQMHTVHCARNIVLCSRCDEPIPKRELEEHKLECGTTTKTGIDCAPKHIITTTTSSNKKVETFRETKTTKTTKATTTEEKVSLLPICQHCQLEFPADQMAEHENYCGCRTEQCPECSDFVMLKEWDKHQSMRLYHELANKPSSMVFKRDEDGLTNPWSSSATSLSFKSETENLDPWSSSTTSLVFKREAEHQNINPLWSSSATSLDVGPNDSYSGAKAKIPPKKKSMPMMQSSDRYTDLLHSSHKDGVSASQWETSIEEQERLLAQIKKASASTPNLTSATSILQSDQQPQPPTRPSRKKGIVDQILLGGKSSAVAPKPKFSPLIDLDDDDDCLPDLISFEDNFDQAIKPSSSTRKYSAPATVLHTSSSTPSFDSSSTKKTSSFIDRYLGCEAKPAKKPEEVKKQLNFASQPSVRKKKARAPLPPTTTTTSTVASTSVSTLPLLTSSASTSSLLSSSMSTSAMLHSASSQIAASPPIRRLNVDGLDNTEQNRESLRQMLCNLRKDPMDEDLENNDGEFFPCEFCGDPYPVEFLMRHQLSCDLNPNPVTEGHGFDYSQIARRAAANIQLARQE